MFITNPKRLCITLVFYIAIVLALITASEAKGYAQPARRDHGGLNRLVRKRSPQADPKVVGPVIGAGNQPPTDSTATPLPSPSKPVAPPNPPAPGSPSVTPPNRPNSPSSSTETVSPTSTTESVATASISSSSSSVLSVPSSSSSSTSALSSISAVLPTTSFASVPPITTSTPDVVLVTSSVDAAASAVPSDVTQKNAAMQKTTTTVLIVIASVVGGVAIIWTIIRKWKLGKSNSFEERMQPIDWQPTNEDTGLPIHRRHSNASSFQSAGHGVEDSISGHGGYGSTSDYGPGNPALPPLPNHDFTAPSANLAPVGGYADLARGPSPGPQMQEVSGHGHYGAQDAYEYNGEPRY